MNMLKKIATTIMMLCIGMMLFPMSAKAEEASTLTFSYAYDVRRKAPNTYSFPMTAERFDQPRQTGSDPGAVATVSSQDTWTLTQRGKYDNFDYNVAALINAVADQSGIESSNIEIWQLCNSNNSVSTFGVLIGIKNDCTEAVFISDYGYYLSNSSTAPSDNYNIDTGNGFINQITSSNSSRGEYTITFDANDGTGIQAIAKTAVKKLASFPTITRDGYTFDGWFLGAEEGAKITEETEFNENTRIYAHWTANSGGSTPPPTTTTTESAPAEAPAQQEEAEPEVVAYIPAMKTTNVSGTQLEGWSAIEKAIPSLTQDKQQDVNGANKDLLHIDVSGFNKTIPTSVIKVTDKATSIAGLHVFIGNSDAITFLAKNDLSGYQETNFDHKDTITEHSRTIEFTHKQDLGTTVMFHTTVPANSTRVTIYKVDAENTRTRIGRTSSNANGQVCFGINETGTYVLEY